MNEEARQRAREAVEAAFQRTDAPPPDRRCPTCGHVAATIEARCPACAKRYDRRLPWLSDRARVALAVAALLLLGGVVAFAAPRISESREERAARSAREQAELERREVARLTRLQRPLRETAAPRDDSAAAAGDRLAARRALVAALEQAILREALVRRGRGEITGSPPREVICGPLVRHSVGGRPVERGEEDDLGRRRGRYDCTAVQRDVVRDGTLVARFGIPFIATIDFRRGAFTYCQDTKIPGERGEALVKVPVPPACLGAEGADRVGDGYAAPES